MGKIKAILSVAILATLSGMPAAADHVKMRATWKNAGAEKMQQALIPISRFAEMTVVDEGKATLYFKGADALEVAMVIRSEASGKLPKDLTIDSTITERGEIPTAPAQSSKEQVTFHISRDKAAKFGISTSDLASQLAKLKAAHPEDLLTAYDTAVFTLPDEKKAPIRELAEIRMIEVKRPLIWKRP